MSNDKILTSDTDSNSEQDQVSEKQKTDIHNNDIEKTLGIGTSGERKRRFRWLTSIGIILLVAVGILYLVNRQNASPVQYKTENVVRGDLTVTVTATGNLEPVNTVEVGSELSGLISKVLVDVNDHVKNGQILAILDTKKLDAEEVQARANLASARASLEQATATLTELRLQVNRARQLFNQGYISQQEFEGYQASLARAEATESSSKAQIEVAEAALNVTQTNLSKAAIRSPIDGIVLTRNIEPGQAVAASFQTPVLFKLAEDLAHMELKVDIDEADVGQVAKGQEATFAVDAYPNRTFSAHLTLLHYASQTVEGVVTYTGVLSVDNKALLLRPGMTATADIITREVKNALLIPNSALRFTPPGISPDQIPNGKVVWTIRDGKPVPVSVTTGLSDEIKTEVLSGDMEPGMPLLVDVISGKQSGNSGSGRISHP